MRRRNNQAARGAFWCISYANQTTKSEILVDNRKVPSLLQLVQMEAEMKRRDFSERLESDQQLWFLFPLLLTP